MGGGGVLYIKLPQDPLRSFYISLPRPVVPFFIIYFVVAVRTPGSVNLTDNRGGSYESFTSCISKTCCRPSAQADCYNKYDQAAIQLGYWLYQTYGTEMTEAQFIQGVNQYHNRLKPPVPNE